MAASAEGFVCLTVADGYCKIGAVDDAAKVPSDCLHVIRHQDAFWGKAEAAAHFAHLFDWTPAPGPDIVFHCPTASPADAVGVFCAGVGRVDVVQERNIFAREHWCHWGLPRAVPVRCDCSTYCTARESQRVAALDMIKTSFPNFAEDVAFGGEQQLMRIVPDKYKWEPGDPPHWKPADDRIPFADLHGIAGLGAGSPDWPTLRVRGLNATWLPGGDSGLGQFERLRELGIVPDVPFALTDELIIAAHGMKQEVHSARPLPWRGPSLADMLGRRVALDDLAEIMFFSTSHVVDGLYAAFQGRVPDGDECENYLCEHFRVSVFDPEDPETAPRRVLYQLEL